MLANPKAKLQACWLKGTHDVSPSGPPLDMMDATEHGCPMYTRQAGKRDGGNHKLTRDSKLHLLLVTWSYMDHIARSQVTRTLKA